MNKTKEIITAHNLVLAILTEDEKARNSDNYLYLKVIESIARTRGFDVDKLTISTLFTHLKKLGIPCYETVRRARQKIQAANPELSGNPKIKEARAKNESVCRDYAVSGYGGEVIE